MLVTFLLKPEIFNRFAVEKKHLVQGWHNKIVAADVLPV